MLDADQLHPVRREKPLQRQRRIVRQMLVIDVVEDAAADEVDAVAGLEREHAVGREQRPNALDQVLQVVDVREHVVRRDDRRRARASARSAPASVVGEERILGRDAGLGRAACLVACRIDAEHRKAAPLECPQQRAVVAADVDDERTLWRTAPLGERCGIGIEVIGQPQRDRGVVDVVAIEQLGIDDVRELQQRAVGAKRQIERVSPLRLAQPRRRHVVIAARRRLAWDDELEPRGLTHPARLTLIGAIRAHRLPFFCSRVTGRSFTGLSCRTSDSCHCSDTPPSTTTVWPVMNDASRPPRNDTTAAISSACPIRPSGIIPS